MRSTGCVIDTTYPLVASGRPTEVNVTMPLHAMIPTLIADAGDQAAWRYVDFFTANIRNPNTRRAVATRAWRWQAPPAPKRPVRVHPCGNPRAAWTAGCERRQGH